MLHTDLSVLHIQSLIVVHLFVSQVHFATPPDNTSSGSNHAFAKPEIHTHSLCTLLPLFTPQLYKKKHLHFSILQLFIFSFSLVLDFLPVLTAFEWSTAGPEHVADPQTMHVRLTVAHSLSIPYFPSYFMDIVSSPPLCSLRLYFCFLFCFVFLFKGQNQGSWRGLQKTCST